MSDHSNRILGLSISGARRLLIASLALNFLIVGVVLGLGLRSDGKDRPRGGAFGAIADIVAEDRREEVASIMAQRSRMRRDLRKARTEDWLKIADLIGAEPFDAGRVAEMLNRYSDDHNARRKAAYGPLMEALAMMTPEERAAVAEKTRSFAEWRSKKR